MKWRFVDSIVRFEPWSSITGIKAISYEEYSLYERFGRPGVLPESLVIECCAQLVQWFIAVSSEYRCTSIVREVGDFVFHAEAAIGDALRIEASVESREGGSLAFVCRVRGGAREIASGELVVETVPLEGRLDLDTTRGMWEELYGSS